CTTYLGTLLSSYKSSTEEHSIEWNEKLVKETLCQGSDNSRTETTKFGVDVTKLFETIKGDFTKEENVYESKFTRYCSSTTLNQGMQTIITRVSPTLDDKIYRLVHD